MIIILNILATENHAQIHIPVSSDQKFRLTAVIKVKDRPGGLWTILDAIGVSVAIKYC